MITPKLQRVLWFLLLYLMGLISLSILAYSLKFILNGL